MAHAPTPHQSSKPAHLEPSLLGTRNYWDETYASESSRWAPPRAGRTPSNPVETAEITPPSTTDPDGEAPSLQDAQPDQTSDADSDSDDLDDASSNNWFSEYRASSKMVDYLSSLTHAPSSSSATTTTRTDHGLVLKDIVLDRLKTSFLDLGTGNGHLLFELRERGGFRGRMVGVDYSAEAVALARKVLAEKRGLGRSVAAGYGGSGGGDDDGHGHSAYAGASTDDITFETWDILRDDFGGWAGLSSAAPPSSKDEGREVARHTQKADTHAQAHAQSEKAELGFDVLLDKGTFDAISLCGDVDAQGRRLSEAYVRKIAPLLRKGTGLLVVTSCNWTEEELCGWFVGGGGGDDDVAHLSVCGRIEYPSFVFGGRRGQSICSVVFRRGKGVVEGS